MIKICHLVSSCLTNHGPSNVLIPIVIRSDTQRYQFHVWSLYATPENRDPGEMLRAAGVDYQAFKMGSFLDVRIVVPLVRRLRLLRPDILHCHLVRANLYGRIAAQMAGVPAVISNHHGIEDYMVSKSLRDRALRSVERLTSKLVTYHVGVSECMRRAAIMHLKLAPDKVVAIPNGVDGLLYDCSRTDTSDTRRELGIDPGALVVGAVGSFTRTKNFQALLRAAKSLVKQHSGIQFVIVGDGELRQEMKKMVNDMGLDRIVILPGFRNDIAKVLKTFDIFASTSTSEGFGLALAEAMACGLPCIAFDVGALSELVADGETGLLVRAGHDDLFTDALDVLISDSNLRCSMGQAGRTRIREKYSMELMVQRYGELYERIILGQKARTR